jgi:hypothetical protein
MSCLCWYVIDESQPIRCHLCNSKEREHTATIDPQIIIQRFLDGEDILPELKGESK